jgi:signal peptidase I
LKKKSLPVKDIVEKKTSSIRENIEAVLVAVLLALFIRTFAVQAFKIPSGSMKQTLQIGDHILVNKFIYGVKIPFSRKTIIPVKKPKHGDIIVFKFPKDPEKDFIKRVVGLAGDKVEIRNKQVFVNNVKADSSFAQFTDSFIVPGCPPGIRQDAPCRKDNFGPIKVPDNKLFVMGDNRDQSFDSRFWGFVDSKAVNGKAFIIYWSWDSDNFGIRWKRVGKMLK